MSEPLAKKPSPVIQKLESKHPLQRFQSPGVGISAFIHVSIQAVEAPLASSMWHDADRDAGFGIVKFRCFV